MAISQWPEHFNDFDDGKKQEFVSVDVVGVVGNDDARAVRDELLHLAVHLVSQARILNHPRLGQQLVEALVLPH